MISNLRDSSDLQEIPQPYAGGPSIGLINTDDLPSFKSKLEVGFRALEYKNSPNLSGDLAEHLLPIKQWTQRLQKLSITNEILPAYELKIWVDGEFKTTAMANASGFYELWPTEDNMPKVTAYYDSDREQWLRGDWYGLRFISRIAAGDEYRWSYQEDTGSLTIPEAWRWPEIYERALVLSSGQLPSRSGGNLSYHWVDEETLSILHKKLDVRD